MPAADGTEPGSRFISSGWTTASHHRAEPGDFGSSLLPGVFSFLGQGVGMPVHDFVRDLSLPSTCRGANPATLYRFTIRVSWDERVLGGATVAENFVFEMLPEVDDAAGNAEFGPGSGLFELKPVGARAFQVDNRNIWH